MKKRFLAIMLCIAAVVSLAGCGASSAPAADKPTDTAAAPANEGASAGKVSIELFHQKPENVELYNTLIGKFMEENPDIQVNITLAETTTTTLISRIAAGNIPDLVSVFPMSASYKDMMKEGIYEEITDTAMIDRVNPSMIDRCTVDGKLYTIPFTTNAYGLYYNVDVFNELGLKVPATMDEMWDVCDKLVAAGYQPFSFPDKKTTRISQMFDRCIIGCVDHDFYSKCDELYAGTYDVTSDPNIRKYAETILKLREYANPDSLGYDDEPAYEEFTSGKSVMYIDGTWTVTTFEKMNPELNFNCTAIPTLTTEDFWTAGTVDTAFAISASASAEKKAACEKLLAFLLREDIAQEFCDGDKNPNVIKGVTYNVEQLKEINALIDSGKFGASLASIWTQDLRNNINVAVQALILDKDVDTFVTTFSDLLHEYYTPQT